jgi:malto-oligosyltrehalose trehalohydrolase
LENDANQAGLLAPAADPPRGKYRAQWNDDYHHAFHVLLTGETTGYYRDYQQSHRYLSRALAQGFAYQGEASAHRNGVPRGEDTAALPATAFVNFLQNHDQIGNRARGERLAELAPANAIEAATVVTLLSPSPPLMFMGDEWGASQPFPFFCDFKGELADAVRRGRKREFAAAFATDRNGIPDPLSEQTFRSAVLDWSARSQAGHKARLDLVRRLIAARNAFVVPLLPRLMPGTGHAGFCGGVLTASWAFASGETLELVANLGDRPDTRPHDFRDGTPIWGGPAPAQLAPWSVHAAIWTA